MKIAEYLTLKDIIPDILATSKDEVLEKLVTRLVERHADVDRRQLLRKIQEREALGSTGIGDGIAIPHAKLRSANKLMVVFGRSIAGVDFVASDEKPAHLFFLLVAQDETFGVHLRLLARISRILKNPAIRKRLLEAADTAAIFNIIQEQDNLF
jgi:PTS system nitrogen regulatory IIA component